MNNFMIKIEKMAIETAIRRIKKELGDKKVNVATDLLVLDEFIKRHFEYKEKVEECVNETLEAIFKEVKND